MITLRLWLFTQPPKKRKSKIIAVLKTEVRLGSAKSQVAAVVVWCLWVLFFPLANRALRGHKESELWKVLPEDKLGNLLLSLVIPFPLVNSKTVQTEGVIEGRQSKGRGGGVCVVGAMRVSESAVISHETKAHSALLWLGFHTLNHLSLCLGGSGLSEGPSRCEVSSCSSRFQIHHAAYSLLSQSGCLAARCFVWLTCHVCLGHIIMDHTRLKEVKSPGETTPPTLGCFAVIWAWTLKIDARTMCQ